MIRTEVLVIFSLLTILLCRLFFIYEYSLPTPYRDDWANGLFLISLTGDQGIDWSSFFQAHNEHRILMSRLLCLFVYFSFGKWAVQIEMILNTLIYYMCIGILLRVVLGGVRNNLSRIIAVVTITCLGSLSLSYESVLMSFQSQFYFLILFSLIQCYIHSSDLNFNFCFYLSLLCALGASFSMAVGLVLFAPLLLYCFKRKSRLQKGQVFIFLFILGLLLFNYQTVPHHETLVIHNLQALLISLGKHFSWPLPWNIPLLWLGVFFFLSAVRASTLKMRRFLFYLTLILFLMLLAMAILRGGYGFQHIRNRYLEIHTLGAMLQTLLVISYCDTRNWDNVARFIAIPFLAGTIYFHSQYYTRVQQVLLPQYLHQIGNSHKLFQNYIQNKEASIFRPFHGSLLSPFPDTKALLEFEDLTKDIRYDKNLFNRDTRQTPNK